MTIERIFIRRAPGGPQFECDQVLVVAGAGIEGDRYFGRHDEPGQNITLVEAEEIEAFLREQGLPYDLSVTHRNLITRGVRLNELVERQFMIGGVTLRGVELCEPCLGFGKSIASAELPAAAAVKRFVHRAGLRADVLSSGVITRGARVANAA
jgi:MOSC domain-containing protein YiiM